MIFFFFPSFFYSYTFSFGIFIVTVLYFVFSLNKISHLTGLVDVKTKLYSPFFDIS